ncbi:MAG: histidine kinase [Bdellovibrionota bacterium]
MSSKDIEHVKPFFSVLIVIGTLFVIVFLQMEERRLGYSLLKLNREHKLMVEAKRLKEIQFAKQNRPQLLDHVAQTKLTLKKIEPDQIVHLNGETGETL